ncbi:MAG: hypothetical protein AUJ70_00165 [Candidatus Omnitrophica bacterium CG1_02_40_15]|nr:MAG: hypothetical protein AUJ70_00165 [Candidatus Omnitrophica bacterium CG1_02_40_15]
MTATIRKIQVIFIIFSAIFTYSQAVLWCKYLVKSANINSCPINAALYLSSGMEYLKSGDSARAKEWIDRALRLDPKNADSYFEAGRALMDVKDKAAAYNYFRQSIIISDNYERDILNIVFQAAASPEELRQVVPQDAQRMFLLAKFYDEKDMCDIAVDEFRSALKFNPQFSIEPYLYFSDSARERKDYDFAAQIWKHYLGLNPKDMIALKRLGSVYIDKKDYASAEDCYLKAVSISPNDIESLNYLGWIYYLKYGFAKAIKHYDNVFKNIRPSANTYFLLGMVYYSEKKYEPALENFRKSVDMDPKSLWVRYYLGQAYFQLGKYNQAILTYREYLKMKPQEFYVLRYFAMALEKNGDSDEALAAYKKAISIKPTDEFTVEAISRIEKDRQK